MALSIFLNSCYKEEIITFERPDGWGYTTHSKFVEPSYDDVFPQDEVKKMYIEITSDDWQTMQDDLENLYGGSSGPPGPGNQFSEEKPVMVKCQVYCDDIQWFDVGIRYKGNSSLRTAYQQNIGKLPLRLDFDNFEDENPLIEDQRFYGFKELSLSSNFQDKSLLHEKLASDLFENFGVAAPKTSFYEIYVDKGDGNGYVYFGLYTMVEVVFDTMLKNRFGNESGNCYKPDGDGAKFKSGTYSTEYFEKKTNETSDWSDIEALYNVLNSSLRTSDEEAWKDDLEAIFDINGYLKYLAANTTMQNWDTYGLMTHNYFLYHDPSDDLIKWIPWDNNESLNNDKNNCLAFDFNTLNGGNWPLIEYIYDVQEYKNIYDAYIDEFIAGPFNPSNINSLVQEYHTLVQSSAYAEQSPYSFLNSTSDYDNTLSTLLNFISQRNTSAAAYTP